MNNYKKLILLIILILIFILISFLVQTFAKYLVSASGNTNMNVARWNIFVNNTSIQNNSDISNTLTPIFPGNEHIANNIIAPTAEGYFDLELDFSYVDVSFEYNISVNPNENSSVQDIVVTGYSVNNGNIINFDQYNSNIKETILLSSNIKSESVRIYVKWIDDETASMNNIEDTIATSSSNHALLDVNISFTQIVE